MMAFTWLRYYNELLSKLVFVINILTVVYCCLLFSYTNRFSTKKKYNQTIFFDDVNVSVTGKIVLILNALDSLEPKE